MLKIENDVAKVEINLQAAEITSFYDKETNTERMWQGDPTFWSGRNPVLFPQVGNTWQKKYTIKGQEYAMGNHGFARHSLFELVSHHDNQIVLVLKDNEVTYAQYPFHFEFYVCYTLKQARLTIEYTVVNLDEEVLPFGFGLHPAFNCPVDKDESFDAYRLVFPNTEQQTTKSKDSLVQSQIALNYKVFETLPTLVYEYLNSPYVDLVSNKYKLRVGIHGYRYLAIWTKQNAPFICIEPWHTHGDLTENNLPFDKREGMINLESKREFKTAYYIEILKGEK